MCARSRFALFHRNVFCLTRSLWPGLPPRLPSVHCAPLAQLGLEDPVARLVMLPSLHLPPPTSTSPSLYQLTTPSSTRPHVPFASTVSPTFHYFTFLCKASELCTESSLKMFLFYLFSSFRFFFLLRFPKLCCPAVIGSDPLFSSNVLLSFVWFVRRSSACLFDIRVIYCMCDGVYW